MSNHANYRIMPELNLILECCKGRATVEDAIQMKKAEIADELYDPGFDILVDFHEFKTMIEPKIYDSAKRFFNFLSGLNIKGRISIFTAEPSQVVAGMVLKNLSVVPGSLRIEVYSTIDAAVRRLGIPDESMELVKRNLKSLNESITIA